MVSTELSTIKPIKLSGQYGLTDWLGSLKSTSLIGLVNKIDRIEWPKRTPISRRRLLDNSSGCLPQRFACSVRR